MFHLVGNAVRPSTRPRTALVGVVWLAFLVAPAFFAFRPEARYVSFYPAAVYLAVGLLLARFCGFRSRWASLESTGAVLLILVSGLTLIAAMALNSAVGLIPNAARVEAWLWNGRVDFASAVRRDFGAHSWLYFYPLLIALTEGIWFRGIWFSMFPRRAWVSVGVGAALCAGWHALVTHELLRIGYPGPGGMQMLFPMFLAALAFGVVRLRGGSWLLIALVDWLLQCALYANAIAGVPIRLKGAGDIALFLSAFVLLLWVLLPKRHGEGTAAERSVMRHAAVWALFLLAALAPVGWTIWTSPFLGTPKSREEAWRGALDYLAAELPRRHLDFHVLMPRARLDAEVAQLKSRVPLLTDDQVALEIRRIMAQLRVAHSEFSWPFAHYPVHIAWLSEGAAVLMTTREYQEAIGCRVVRIGTATPEEMRSKCAPYISHENEAWLNAVLLIEGINKTLVDQIGAVAPDGSLRLTLEKEDASVFTMDIWPLVPGSKRKEPEPAAMLPRQHLVTELRNYEAKYRGEDKALHVFFRHCAEDARYPFEEFKNDLDQLSAEHPIERVIVDLRSNTGGTSSAVGAFMEILRKSPVIREKTPPLVLIGNQTYSAGLITAIAIRAEFGGVLLGEPTGGKPVFYGNAEKFSLPHTKGEVSYATVKVELGNKDEVSLRPDITAEVTLDDLRKGHDAAYQAAIASRISRSTLPVPDQEDQP